MSGGDKLSALEGLLSELTGVKLTRGGLRTSLAAFAERRMRELGLDSMDAYFVEVASPRSDERRRLLDVISVPHTWFFRDPHQLDVVVDLLVERIPSGRAAKIWVPACATGEDAYSLALLCGSRGLRAQIVASDISPRSLSAARLALYGAFSLREFPEQFRRSLVPDGKLFRVSDEVRKQVEFAEHNLMHPPLLTADGWDLILCRNVFIYFDQPTAVACAERLGGSLAKEGWLFFAAGEMAHASPSGLRPLPVNGRVGFVRADAASATTRAASVPGTLRIEPTASHRDLSSSGVPIPSLGHILKVPLRPEPAGFALPQAEDIAPRVPGDSLAPREFRRFLENGPVEASGDRLFSGSAFIEAAEDILRLAAESPLSADLRMLSGVALYTVGDFAGGLCESRAALLLNPGLWPAALYQGLCLERLGEQSQARGDFLYAAKLLAAPEARDLVLPLSLRGLAGDLLEMVRQKVTGLRDPG